MFVGDGKQQRMLCSCAGKPDWHSNAGHDSTRARRQVDPSWLQFAPEDEIAFQDNFPILMASEVTSCGAYAHFKEVHSAEAVAQNVRHGPSSKVSSAVAVRGALKERQEPRNFLPGWPMSDFFCVQYHAEECSATA